MAAVLAPCLAWGGPNAGATVYVDADPSTAAIEYSAVGTGTVVRIAVRIRDAQYLDGYSFDLAYDTARLDFVKAEASLTGTANILETRGGTAVAFVGRLSREDTARVSVGNALAGTDSTRSPSGEGLLAVLEFHAKTPGMARFAPSRVQLLDYAQVLDTAISVLGGSVDVMATVGIRRLAAAGKNGMRSPLPFDLLGRSMGQGLAQGPTGPSLARFRR